VRRWASGHAAEGEWRSGGVATVAARVESGGVRFE
jgi:hypothetical protein